MAGASGDELRPESIHLLEGALERAARVDDDVGDGESFVVGCLGVDAVLGGFSIEATKPHQPVDALGGGGVHDHDERELLCRSGLDQQGHVIDDDRIGLLSFDLLESFPIEPGNLGMNDRVEGGTFVLVLEDPLPQCGAVKFSVRGDDAVAEPLPHSFEPGGPGLHRSPGKYVGVDHHGTPLSKTTSDGRFPRSDSAREPDDIHGPTLTGPVLSERVA